MIFMSQSHRDLWVTAVNIVFVSTNDIASAVTDQRIGMLMGLEGLLQK